MGFGHSVMGSENHDPTFTVLKPRAKDQISYRIHSQETSDPHLLLIIIITYLELDSMTTFLNPLLLHNRKASRMAAASTIVAFEYYKLSVPPVNVSNLAKSLMIHLAALFIFFSLHATSQLTFNVPKLNLVHV